LLKSLPRNRHFGHLKCHVSGVLDKLRPDLDQLLTQRCQGPVPNALRHPSGSTTDPTGAASGSLRVYRGGSWSSYSDYCHSASRIRLSPGLRRNFLGFRVLRSSIK
jgi:hypothetical protein